LLFYYGVVSIFLLVWRGFLEKAG